MKYNHKYIFTLIFLMGMLNPMFVVEAADSGNNTSVSFVMEDSYISSVSIWLDRNYGNESSLRLAPMDPEGSITYLAFNVTDIPSDAYNIYFKLYVSVIGIYGPFKTNTIEIFIYQTSEFSEDTLTFNNAPDLEELISRGTIYGEGIWELMIFGEEIFSKNGMYYFSLLANGQDVSAELQSKEDTLFSESKPRLEVIYSMPISITIPGIETVIQTVTDTDTSQMVLGGIIGGIVGAFVAAATIAILYFLIDRKREED